MGEASTPLSARPTPPDASVTTVVRRRVRSDRREEYESSLRRLLEAAQRLEGFLGAQVVRPPEGGRAPEYTSVFRFSTLEQLRRFEGSDLRARFLEEVAPLVESDAIWEHHTGLELWFDAPAGTVVPQPVRWRMAVVLGTVVPQPVRWRMAVVLGTVVYLLVLAFGTAASAVLGGVPYPLRLALVIAAEITLMTYLLLPWLTRRLARWIYPMTSIKR